MPTADLAIPTTPVPTAIPELLAPAGDRDCLRAAIENGADAVYFGLQTHNARARATNFAIEELPEIMASLHRRGVRGYVTLNTLIFPAELEGAEALVRRIAAAGADAIIAQDMGLCRLARETAPGLEVHASTQMSITSAEGVKFAESLGCSRVILARELSLVEIARVRAETDAAGRGLRPRGALRGVLGPVPHQRGPRRSVGEPGRMRPGVSTSL